MLKKILPLISLSLINPLSGKTTPGIYGYITSDTTWQDTVEVVGDVVVKGGAILIIKPGTVVRFLADTSAWDDTAGFKGKSDIIVYGKLKLRGTSTDSITFTSTEESGGSWGGIRYCSSSRDTVEYVVLYYGMRALAFNSALNVSIQHCRIWAVSGQYLELGEEGVLTGIGILLRGDSVSIKSSVISSVFGGVGDVPYDFYIGGDAYGILCESCSFLEIFYDTIGNIRGGPSYGSDGGFPYKGGDATGIDIQNANNIFIRGCLLQGCSGGDGPERGTGLALGIGEGFATIESSCIRKNDSGIILSSSGILGGELLYANDIYDNVLCNYPDSINARYNYWGTVDEIEIVAKTNVSMYSPWTDSLHKNLYYSSGIYGEITKDTVWKGEVKIRGDIVISRGATLFIEPGTKIRFTARSFWNRDTGTSKCDIFVYGNVKAIGNISDTIQFGDTLSGIGDFRFCDGSNGTIKFCRLRTIGIHCNNASPHIESNEIECGIIDLYSASPRIYNNTIYSRQYGISCNTGSSPQIVSNSIEARDFEEPPPMPHSPRAYGIITSSFSSPIIQNNEIIAIAEGYGNPQAHGIHCSSPCIIEGNTIYSWCMEHVNEVGIFIEDSGQVMIKGNIISSREDILCVKNSRPSIFSNYIEIDKGTGIVCKDQATPLIGGDPEHWNVFKRNPFRKESYFIKNYTPNSIIATYNYWGTNNPDSISMLIFDHNDDPQYGYVIFEPFITDTIKPDTTPPDTSKPLPDSFAFHPLFPNPFMRVCNISYSFPEPASVKIEIFNITGRKIWDLFEPNLEKGDHQTLWDGKDKKGRELPKGIYFIRFEAAYYIEEKGRQIAPGVYLTKSKLVDYLKTQKVVLLR